MAQTHSDNITKALEFAAVIPRVVADNDIALLAPYRGQTAMFMTIVRLFATHLIVGEMQYEFIGLLRDKFKEWEIPMPVTIECLFSLAVASGTDAVRPGEVEAKVLVSGFDGVEFILDPFGQDVKDQGYDFCFRLYDAAAEFFKTGNIADETERELFVTYLCRCLALLHVAIRCQPCFIPAMDAAFILERSKASEEQAAYLAEFGAAALGALLVRTSGDDVGEISDATA
ncbi:MAG TPA: hypothetical protein DEO49_07975 [Sutterella sp.]|nr:hypothetical protein [Sutterella sp.]